ncbi:hypothetical protein WPS_03220 [Vulcanimicrobium alpinum]|uniref:Carbohydrate-binding domain-containing protein n=1 Tax=Vulcanimicrobium alpinum TaxID=3016050 RepID=A0AAN1XV88_UNVUL|nr:hypothetical protein WPS_03220 [Vulcanimicrobium alpinum]
MFASLRALLIVVALALAPLALLIPAAAATTLPAGPLALRRAASPLPLEPSLADTRWADALTDGRFTNLATRAAAAGTTRVAFFYDDRAIYVGVQAEQTAPVVASQPADEIGFGTDDFVGFEIDTAGNGERVYLFAVTPRGTRYAFARESTRYKPEWGAAAASTATGWNAVMRIPYGALKLAGDGFQHWKINLVRNVAATAEHDTLVYTPLMADATVPTFPNYAFDWRFWPPVDGVALRGAVPRPKPRAEVYGLESAGTDRDAVVTPAGTTVRRAPRAGGGDVVVPLDPTTSFRRRLLARFLQRRDRPADDRAAAVPARAHRVLAVLRAGRGVRQRRARSLPAESPARGAVLLTEHRRVRPRLQGRREQGNDVVRRARGARQRSADRRRVRRSRVRHPPAASEQHVRVVGGRRVRRT